MTTDTLNLDALPTRCARGFDRATQHPGLCDCTDSGEWAVFRAALTAARRPDATIHQCDVRPLIRGRIEPKHVGQFWRKARTLGLVADTGEREPSDDVRGRNADKLDRIYRWAA